MEVVLWGSGRRVWFCPSCWVGQCVFEPVCSGMLSLSGVVSGLPLLSALWCERVRPVRSYKGFGWGRSKEPVPWDSSGEVVAVRADRQLR